MTPHNPRLVIHIGQHKTGSKALQSFLSENRSVLQEQGILYPAEVESSHGIRAYTISHFRLFALVRREAIAAILGEEAAATDWARHAPFCCPFETARDFFEAIDADLRRSGLDQVVVSAEDLFDMHTAHELTFVPGLVEAGASLLAAIALEFGYDPQVVVYLRRQDHLLGAHYVQFIKGSPIHFHGFEEFSREFEPRLDTRDILARWADAFGPDRVLVRLYEKASLPGGIVPDFFEQVLGLPIPARCQEPTPDAETVNRSLDRDFVEFLRVLNRRSVTGQSVFDRDAVLAAALREEAPEGSVSGIAGWLSPGDRRDLLASFEEGNAALARVFLDREDGCLFADPPPEDEPGWQPYPGLTADRTMAIAMAVHETTLARQRPAEPPDPEVVPFATSPPSAFVRKIRRAMSRLARRAEG